MTTLAKGLLQTVEPTTFNSLQPHCALAQMLDVNFTYAHALTSRDPAAAALPDPLAVDAFFVHDAAMLIEPPEVHWNDAPGHEFKRRHLRAQHNKVFIHVLENVEALHHLLHHYGAITDQELASSLGWISDARDAYDLDDVISFIEMPQWLLIYYDLVRLIQKYSSDTKFIDAERRFCLVLLYPHDDFSSYALNLNYRWTMPSPANNIAPYNVLCGYRLGRSKIFHTAARRVPAIYLEERLTITTLFSQYGSSLLDFTRSGLVGRVIPQKYV